MQVIYMWMIVGMMIGSFLGYVTLVIYFNVTQKGKNRLWTYDEKQGLIRKYSVAPDTAGYADIGDRVKSIDGTGIEKVPYAINTQVSRITEVYPDFLGLGREMAVSLHLRNHSPAISITTLEAVKQSVKDTVMRTKAARNDMILMTFMKISQRLLSRLKENVFSITNLLCFAILIGLVYTGYQSNKQLEAINALKASIEALANMIAQAK